MRVYLNLTSGLEASPRYPGAGLVRLQSSHMEAGALWRLVRDCDYGFLIDAATHGVVLVDGGSRRGEVSRAQWQGVPWLLFAYARANRLPLAVEPRFYAHFDHTYRAPSPDKALAIAKLRYVHRLTGSPLVVETRSFRSTLDGDYSALSRMLGASAREAA